MKKNTREEKSTIQGNMGGKGKWKWKEIRWRRDLERACSTRFWEGKCGANMESTGKGSTWKERVEGYGEVRWSRHARQDFGRGSAG